MQLQKEEKLSDWYKNNPTDTIWWIDTIDQVGNFLFSFDKKTVYNFFSDWEELTEKQKEIFKKENPVLAELKS